MKLDIKVTGLDETMRKLDRLKDFARDSAIQMAVNKVAAKGKTEITRAITERYAIKAKDVSSSITLRPASIKTGKLTAEIQIFGSSKMRGRSLNMIHFVERKVTLAEARKRSKNGTLNQLRFQITKGGGLKTIPGAFIGNNGRTVFRRVGSGRLPIEPVQVIGVSQMFNYGAIRERVIARIESEFNVELSRAVEQKIRTMKL